MTDEKQNPVTAVVVEEVTLVSDYLEREVIFDVYLPVNRREKEPCSLLLFNDGQDLRVMQFEEMLDEMFVNDTLLPLICIGIHCGPKRKLEYGTAYSADYKGRGSRAGLYTKFIFEELLPFVRQKYGIPSFLDKSFAGFSLGGLSALDIAWNHSSEFTRIGLFSASLWWRRKGYDDGYDDEMDRLMHLQIRKGSFHPWLRFFIECGKLDETADRNDNGVIDSIDDALDLIVELKAKGFTDEHIHYLELAEGTHDVKTWATALPKFLSWVWKK